MLFDAYFRRANIDVPENVNYLLVKIDNSDASISHSSNKLFKMVISRQTVKCFITAQRNSNDGQFTIKGDGFFAGFLLKSASLRPLSAFLSLDRVFRRTSPI
jgi:hypothetical protein